MEKKKLKYINPVSIVSGAAGSTGHAQGPSGDKITIKAGGPCLSRQRHRLRLGLTL